jgi:two-component system OmpR family sensor kinase
VRSRAIAAAAFALLIVAFVVDAITPQTLVIAILLDVPIVFAALTGAGADVLAGRRRADRQRAARRSSTAHDGYRWQPIGVGDRFLAMLSIVLVGYLGTDVQERAESVGRLGGARVAGATRRPPSAPRSTASALAFTRARHARDRARSAAAARRRARVLVSGRRRLRNVGGARRRRRRRGHRRARVIGDRLARPPRGRRRDGQRRATGRSGRPVRPRRDLGAKSAIAVPLADRGTAYGVLIAAFGDEAPDDATVQTARGFAGVAVNALSQARLFGELAERNEALSERQDVIRDLVYALSHDLRTPLAALSMTLRQAADGAYGPLPETYAAVLRDSLVSVDDLGRLADTLLLVARFESGDRTTEHEPLDMSAVAREIASELHAMADARSIALMVQADGEARVRGSRGDLKRAVANLTANALQHTPQGGTVELRVAPDRDVVRLSVTDDGYGLDERVRARLFQRFSSGWRSGGGTGLGLYIVRRIAEENGGSVRYAAREPRGSVFTLTLPKARE